MKKCKICGMYASHISNSHLEGHGLTREEYNKIDIKDEVFRYSMKVNREEVDEYIITAINKQKRKLERSLKK